MVTTLQGLAPAIADVLTAAPWGLRRSSVMFSAAEEPEGPPGAGLDDVFCVDLSGDRVTATSLDGGRLRYRCRPSIRRRILIVPSGHEDAEARMWAWLHQLAVAWTAGTEGFGCLASFTGAEPDLQLRVVRQGRYILGEFVGTAHVHTSREVTP